jgi:hypothetical protein
MSPRKIKYLGKASDITLEDVPDKFLKILKSMRSLHPKGSNR